MELRPISIRAANAAVAEWHRHLKPPQGAKFALAAYDANLGEARERLVGVAMVGRPVSRHDDDGLTAEVIRVATDGTRNASSFLYGAAKRAAQAMGFRRVLTKTLPHESGASLRAVGAIYRGRTKGGSWSRTNRPRIDKHPTTPKLQWEL